VGIRDDIRKGRTLKAILVKLDGRSVDKDEFNAMLIGNGLQPLPSDAEAEGGEGEGGGGGPDSSDDTGVPPGEAFTIPNDIEAPVVPNLFEGSFFPAIFDIETYPNFFLAVFLDAEGFHAFTLADREALVRFFSDESKIFVGFNNNKFDNHLLQQIYDEEDATAGEVFDLAQEIIEGGRRAFEKTMFDGRSVDLHQMRFFGSSLKEIAARIGWPLIQCLPYPPGTELAPEQMREVVRYCANDVLITARLWGMLQDDVSLRLKIGKGYGISALSDSESRICEKLFRHLYQEKTGWTLPRRVERPDKELKGADLIPPWVSFKAPRLCKVLEDFKSIRSTASQMKTHADREIEFCGKVYHLGIGGIHSADEAGVFEASGDDAIVDLDVASYYPSIILASGLCPDHLGVEWTKILGELTEKRLAAKKAGDKITSDTLKIMINGANGKTLDERSFMHDPKVYFSVVLTGQLCLLMLIEALQRKGMQVLSANTDGVIVSLDRGQTEAFENVCREWEEATGFQLERTDALRYARRDINNYVLIKKDGTVKTKGVFEEPSMSRKADAPVISRALRDYYVSGRQIEETIKDAENVLDFAYSFTAKRGFSIHAGEEELQSTVRWYVARQGVALYKRKEGRQIKIPNAESVRLINRLDSTEVPGDLDFEHYMNQAKSIIDKITGKKP
jgi:hypothetical protein